MGQQIRKKLAYGVLTDLIIESIAELFMESGRYSPPPKLGIILGNLLKAILEQKRNNITSDKLKRAIRSLKKRKIIYLEEKEDKVFVHLDDQGRSKVFEYSLKMLIDFKKKKKIWNKKWFLVFFDVPEIERNKRDYLRRYLKKLGFYQYQQSVYLFPYECEKEVEQIKKIVEGAKYIKYIVAEKIEDEESAKRFFRLS
ncbi:CRISPR-associated endonuclease Cas2 [Candidatus Roizmanbacteria bacterium RIFCSPLOWO2_01_FULL_37_12]|uniref:CRISPR-associated endonuclease Cas2 n=1 Tax=Candidatus Roizmanbacteria bacterium RIFCSPLOWO2_01_FULL_37_12 TaxID=1802056 RepID=A0A1F7IG14_9BACT|nr:MAG: CRISPR-associated endonuclease Cas2 [Candidatus Roizmanbacteria bacterium RIFCSPHIGHO2_01_FULL_37_16]OGK24315.1 MAG: CRISPR-associated endonuclease Cas2 [Candidatus Roizmanbacteria bacterium RIFCSPHIGHO2_02_FULL_37_9b]OGK42286.1 MAG: CRISPR-associated endonuclease Cas2 [Candidatus Roizmanbacteria bacterium RIFCSPLOWO2_01_FULL_37_12]